MQLYKITQSKKWLFTFEGLIECSKESQKLHYKIAYYFLIRMCLM